MKPTKEPGRRRKADTARRQCEPTGGAASGRGTGGAANYTLLNFLFKIV
jgi:hypothetical protein